MHYFQHCLIASRRSTCWVRLLRDIQEAENPIQTQKHVWGSSCRQMEFRYNHCRYKSRVWSRTGFSDRPSVLVIMTAAVGMGLVITRFKNLRIISIWDIRESSRNGVSNY